jgi:hypothetical protein
VQTWVMLNIRAATVAEAYACPGQIVSVGLCRSRIREESEELWTTRLRVSGASALPMPAGDRDIPTFIDRHFRGSGVSAKAFSCRAVPALWNSNIGLRRSCENTVDFKEQSTMDSQWSRCYYQRMPRAE